jgi:hypothetical protein
MRPVSSAAVKSLRRRLCVLIGLAPTVPKIGRGTGMSFEVCLATTGEVIEPLITSDLVVDD